MVKLAILILAAAVGAAALAGAGRARALELAAVEGFAAAPPDAAPERKRARIVRLRVCMGPARIAFGGERPVRISFGGEGCGRDPLALLAFAIEHPEAAALATRL